MSNRVFYFLSKREDGKNQIKTWNDVVKILNMLIQGSSFSYIKTSFTCMQARKQVSVRDSWR